MVLGSVSRCALPGGLALDVETPSPGARERRQFSSIETINTLLKLVTADHPSLLTRQPEELEAAGGSAPLAESASIIIVIVGKGLYAPQGQLEACY